MPVDTAAMSRKTITILRPVFGRIVQWVTGGVKVLIFGETTEMPDGLIAQQLKIAQKYSEISTCIIITGVIQITIDLLNQGWIDKLWIRV